MYNITTSSHHCIRDPSQNMKVTTIQCKGTVKEEKMVIIYRLFNGRHRKLRKHREINENENRC